MTFFPGEADKRDEREATRRTRRSNVRLLDERELLRHIYQINVQVSTANGN